jgi:putative ABC transport system permease protein
MRSWVIALRIARREALRAKGRTALIITMIALPVMALSFAAATYDMYKLTPQESINREMGSADALVSWVQAAPIVQSADQPEPTAPATELIPSEANLRTLLPTGSQLSRFWRGSVTMRTVAGVGSLDSFGIDMNTAVTNGLAHIRSGRAPRTDTEVVASPQALTRLGAKIGSKVTALPDGSPEFPAHTYTVVGTVQVDSDLGQTLVFMPSQMPDANNWLVSGAGPIGLGLEQMLNPYGIQVISRALQLDPPPSLSPSDPSPTVAGFNVFGIGTLVAGLGLLEVVLLAGPAFTVGARRRQRDLALVATSGGSPSVLRRIVLADGVVGGLAAGAIGLVLGLGAAFAARPFLEQHLSHQAFGAYRVEPLAIVAVAGLALLTGVLGALAPAFTASRQDVVAALTGRRGSIRSGVRWLLLGIAGVAVAAVITFAGAERHDSTIVLAGLVVGELSLVLCTPTLVGFVARLGRFLPVSPRIALRDTARRRAAAAPAISAVMAAVAGSVALTVYLGASSARDNPYQPTLPIGSLYIYAGGLDPTQQAAEIHAQVARVLPAAKQVTVTAYDADKLQLAADLPVEQQCPYAQEATVSEADAKKALKDPRCADANSVQYSDALSPFVTTDPAVLTATLGLTGTPLSNAVATLDRGGVVVTDSRLIVDGKVTLHTADYPSRPNLKTAAFPAIAVSTNVASAVIVSPPVLHTFGLTQQTLAVVVTPTHPLTQTQTDALTAALAEHQLSGAFIESGPSKDAQTIAIILALAAGVIALGAAAIATGLAAVDGRGDLMTLGAVGATPRMRRILALCQSGTIAGLGSLLGAAAGLGAGAAVLYGINQVYVGKWPAPAPYPIEVPWLNLGVSLVIVPLVAMLGAGLLTRSRLPSERRAD